MTMFSPENRAAAPASAAPIWSRSALSAGPLSSTSSLSLMPDLAGQSPTAGPTTRPSPTATALPAISPERKSRTLQGPSSKEWARHRETIVGLYREYPLKKVSELMKKQYGFVARLLNMTVIKLTDDGDSKRMYDKRFREWNIFKNGNSEDGPKGQRRRSPGSVSSSAAAGLVGDTDAISQADVRKTIRCAKSVQHGFRKPQAPAPSIVNTPGPSSEHLIRSHSVSSQSPRGSINISDLISERSSTGVEGYSPKTFVSSPEMPCATPDSSTGSDEFVMTRSDAGSAASSPPASLIAYQAQLQTLARAPLPALVSDPRTRTLEVITVSLRDYYEWQLQNIPEGVLPDEYLGNRTAPASTKYWDTIKNAIYLVKIAAGSPRDSQYSERAWPAMSDVGAMAMEAMKSQPFDFLKNLFATLSPANLSARPELRSILLQFLSLQAEESLPTNHPITLICQELRRDENCQEISRRGLQCMLDIFNTRLGRSRAVTIKLTDSLATLLRRNGEIDAARDIILELLKSCRQAYGQDSTQARAVENELSHLYMATNDYELALGHCMSVITARQTSDSLQGTFIHDGISAHTMEDIAEIHHRQGDLKQCIMWLERAASIALEVWGPKSLATCHIVDKMTGLSKEISRELLRTASRWEAILAGGD